MSLQIQTKRYGFLKWVKQTTSKSWRKEGKKGDTSCGKKKTEEKEKEKESEYGGCKYEGNKDREIFVLTATTLWIFVSEDFL